MAGPQGMSKEVIYIIIAVVCGLFGLWQVNEYVEGRLNDYRSQLTNTVEVVQLARTISVGGVLKNDDLVRAEVPQAFKMDRRAVKWSDRAKVVDRAVNATVERGELLMWYAMDMGAAASIKDKIPPGQKAVTITVGSNTGSAGMLRPNMSVDLYVVYEVVHKTDKTLNYMQAQLLKENVTIVACDSKTSAESMNSSDEAGLGYSTITILVENSDVERMLLANAMMTKEGGSITTVLRSEMDAKLAQYPRPMTSTEVLREWFSRMQTKDEKAAPEKEKKAE